MLKRLKKRIAGAVESLLDDAVRRTVRRVLESDAFDIAGQLQRNALEETAAFVQAHLLHVPSFADHSALLEAAIQAAPRQGLVCEFGVAAGESLNFIAERVAGTVYGFDSFDGLPEDWAGLKRGAFKQNGLPSVRTNATLIKGLFGDTLPAFVDEHPGPCALLHIDCDLFSSTETVFRYLGPKIITGDASHSAFEYLGYVRTSQQAAVRIS